MGRACPRLLPVAAQELAPTGAELAAPGRDLRAATVADRRRDAGRRENLSERVDSGRRAPPQVASFGDGIRRDKVHVAEEVLQPLRYGAGVVRSVVQPRDERDLERDAPMGARQVAPTGGHEEIERVLPIERYQDIAQGIVAGVKRDGQVELQGLLGQPLDAGHDARRR